MIKKHIPRWIIASLMSFYKSILDVNQFDIALLREADVTHKTIQELKKYFLFTYDGPTQVIRAKNQYLYTLEASFIVTTKKQFSDMYVHERTVGIAQECFPACIAVFRYGDGTSDTREQLGQLEIVGDVKLFGLNVPGDVPINQTSISAQYRMEYNGD